MLSARRWITRIARRPLQPLHAAMYRWVLRTFPPAAADGIDYDQPAGDPGLFGPDSSVWRIHACFPGMLAGGLAALTMQTLHPLALAGVWEHSNFRYDLLGRLRRTTTFVGATTYAPTGPAEAMIEHVHRLHEHITGRGEDGRAYAANDPALLTWVHVTQAWCFLQGYRRYSHVALPIGTADRYYDEVRRTAEKLGATGVPSSQREVDQYFQAIQRDLIFTERARVVLALLSQVQLPVPAATLARDVFLGAGAALLPDWAVTMLRRTPRQQRAARLAAAALWSVAPAFRAALQNGIASRSCRRVGMPPECLHRWA